MPIFYFKGRKSDEMKQFVGKIKANWQEFLIIVLGSFLTAYAFQVFLMPNNIIYGGVSSVSIITQEYFGWSPSIVQYAINIPLLIASFVFLGREIGMKSVLGSLLVPFFIALISHWEPVTTDPMLGAIFGGALSGVGIGVSYKFRASSGGTSTVAQIIDKYTSFSLGMGQLLADGLVVFFGFLVFDIEAILYGLLSLVLISRIIDMVQTGTRTQKNVLIISPQSAEIRHEILTTFDRGVTQFDARGGYNNQKREVLMVVIEGREFNALERMVTSIDEDAFMVVMSASEVFGNGFSLEKYFSSEPEYFDELS